MSRTLIATLDGDGKTVNISHGDAWHSRSDELKEFRDALKDLENATPDTIVQGLQGLVQAVTVAIPRLTYLSTWLESRGLPLDWTGPLDAWAWVVVTNVKNGRGEVIAVFHKQTRTEAMQAASFALKPGSIFRWDSDDPDMPGIRAEALRIEAERRNG